MFQSKKKLRKSGLLFALVFNSIFFILPLLLKSTLSYTTLIISILIIFISLINPYLLKVPLNYWIKFGSFAAKINSTLILAIFFYVILFPAALIRKIFKTLIPLSKKKNISYYEIPEKISSSKMKDQY